MSDDMFEVPGWRLTELTDAIAAANAAQADNARLRELVRHLLTTTPGYVDYYEALDAVHAALAAAPEVTSD